MRDQVAGRNEERLQIESWKTQKSGRETPAIPKGLGLGSMLFLMKTSQKWIANCSVAPSNLYTAFPMGGEDSQYHSQMTALLRRPEPWRALGGYNLSVRVVRQADHDGNAATPR